MNAPSASLPAALPASPGKTENQQYLTFSVGGEIFAIGILHIKEILEFGRITRVPLMPAFVRGVLNLRGAVVPVIDQAARFGRPLTQAGRRTCIVIIEIRDGDTRQDVGIVVDCVNEVQEISAHDVEPPPGFGATIRSDFIQGMGKVGGEFVIILNIPQVLSLEEIARLSASHGATSAASTD